MARCLAILTLSLSIAACSASGPAFRKLAVPPGKAVIYAYRPDAFFGRVRSPYVYCGDGSVDLKPGGYHPFVVEPGSVTCISTTEPLSMGFKEWRSGTAKVEVRVEAGKESFVKEKLGYFGTPYLFLMDRFSAESEIPECKLQP